MIVRQGFRETIGNTPLIRLKQASENTGCNIFGKADSLQALLWAALLGGLIALLMALFQRGLSLRQGVDAWLSGAKSIALAMMILVLAWS